ncbi:MAG TPA: hypothetical protein PLT66_04235, partial [Bacillota bacterium]|nr:hypothetical protein [Bacillota bacterium]
MIYPYKIRKMGKQVQQKKTKLPVIISVILCLPLILIAFLAVKYVTELKKTEEITQIRLTYPNTTVSVLSDEQAQIYKDILLDASSVTQAPEDTTGRTPIVVSYVYGSSSVSYDMYLSSDLNKCFLVSADLKFLSIPVDTAYSLMLDDTYSFIYEKYSLPVLTMNGNGTSVEILPTSYTWNFEKVDGVMYLSNEKEHYTPTKNRYTLIDDALNSLAFSIAPDAITVEYISDNGISIYESNNVGEISVDAADDINFNIHVSAEWYAHGDDRTTGKAEYIIQVLYDFPESFVISSETVKAGDVLTITASQLDVSQEVTFKTNLKNISLNFTDHNGNVFTYVPVDCTNLTGSYFLTLSVEGRETTFNIYVEGQNYGAAFYNPDKELSDKAQEELDKIFSSVNSKYESIPYYTNSISFASPVKVDALITYGKEVFYASSPTSVQSIGVLYNVSSGTSVKATEGGRV